MMSTEVAGSASLSTNELLVGYPREARIHEVFSAVARSQPQAVAIVSKELTLSYSELDALSNQLARQFQDRGVRPGSIVCFLTVRSVETVVGWLATLKCGAAYLPTEPSFPNGTLESIVEDANPSLILAQGGFFDTSRSICGETVFCLEKEIEAAAVWASEAVISPGRSTDLAYVMYTSGSTGRPKGVCLHHKGTIRLVRDQPDVSFYPSDRIMLNVSVTFDACSYDVWGALLNGSSIAVVKAATLSLDQISDAIRRFEINTLDLTAALFHLFVDHRLADLKPLRQLLVGGDVMSPCHARRAVEMLPNTSIINIYGPTENTTNTTCYKLPKDGWGDGPVPIGKAINHTATYILDEARKPVSRGETGFLWVGGDGVALGYLNRPELTSELFVPDPFNNEPGAMMYCTGDLVKVREDDNLEFLGRKDRQVKIAGQRIELDEIEIELRRDPLLSDAVAVIDIREGDEKRLVAFCRPVAGVEQNGFVVELRRRLARRLPCQLIPTDIRLVDNFPMTVNDKVDRKALLSGANLLERRTRYIVSPIDELESKLSQIFCVVLKLDSVGRTENFFDLGGTSLHIMSVHEELIKDIAPDIDIIELFRHPTIEDLAEFLRGVSRSGNVRDQARARGARQSAALKRARAARGRNKSK